MAEAEDERAAPRLQVPLEWLDETSQATKDAYRNGEPLRAMAATHNSEITRLSTTMAVILDESDELARCRSVHRRSVATAVELRAKEELVDRLTASGIARTDIPTILTALGSQLDIEMAIELLSIPSGPLDVPDEPRRLGDKLSLLYVVGRHHGVEPDYELALGKMSLDAVTKLRDLLRPEVPYRHLADILGVIEATARAVRTRGITTLAYQEYEDTARKITQELGMITRDQAAPWPVPARTLRRRYGRGFWEDALVTVGLALPAGTTRFGRDDYFQALNDFTEECLGADYPMDIGTYDRWVVADSAMGIDRPSVVDMIRRYGSWEAAVETILPSDQQEDTQPADGEPKYIDYDSGWGTLEELEEWEAKLDEEWRARQQLIGQIIETLAAGSFLHIQYAPAGDGQVAPYARATPNSGTVLCEIISHTVVNPQRWRLSADWLSSNGWTAPNTENAHWHKTEVPRPEATGQILNAIRFGRVPVEAADLSWTIGRLPDSSVRPT